MRIEHENTLRAAMTNGINLFVGAGFSTLATGLNGNTLPCGSTLLKELQTKFHVPYEPLAQCCSYLEKTKSKEYKQFLIDCFTIKKCPSLYENICLINIKNIFTTNIDNLIPIIYTKSKVGRGFLNDKRTNGASVSENAINYLPLHGNVDTPEEAFVMGTEQLANVYNRNQRAWSSLSQSIEMYPTIFFRL